MLNLLSARSRSQGDDSRSVEGQRAKELRNREIRFPPRERRVVGEVEGFGVEEEEEIREQGLGVYSFFPTII